MKNSRPTDCFTSRDDVLSDAEEFPLLFPIVRESFAEFCHGGRLRFRDRFDHAALQFVAISESLEGRLPERTEFLGLENQREVFRLDKDSPAPIVLALNSDGLLEISVGAVS